MKYKVSIYAYLTVIITVAIVIYTVFHLKSRNPNEKKEYSKLSKRLRGKVTSSIQSIFKPGHYEKPEEILQTDIYNNYQLPNFVIDSSEYIIGSLIERSSFDYKEKGNTLKPPNLHVTTFMLCHYMLATEAIPKYFRNTNINSQEQWRKAREKFANVEYYASGIRRVRKENRFFCRIHPTNNVGDIFVVEGHFVPNRVTSDSNANRRIDILRCPMPSIDVQSISQFVDSNSVLVVDVIRGNSTLIRFSIPWRTRRTGFLLSQIEEASHLDAWKNSEISSLYDNNSNHINMDRKQSPIVHLCVPGVLKPVNKFNLPLFLEFISHHLLLGVDHIYFPTARSWESPSTKLLIRILKSYIEEEKLTVVSQSAEYESETVLFLFGGNAWDTLFMKILQSNMCLYLSKGLSDYVVILDIDEFFIPKQQHNSFGDIIRAIQVNNNNELTRLPYVSEEFLNSWKGGPGWADKDAHPYCYISVNSEIVLHKSQSEDLTKKWIGDRFAHGTEYNTSLTKFVRSNAYLRLIIPTELIFYTGINLPGACKLPYGWNGCTDASVEFSVKANRKTEVRRLGKGRGGENVDLRTDHNFDELVTEGDGKRLNQISEATVYHYSLYNKRHIAGKQSSTQSNDYTKRFFQSVLSDIRKRNLDIFVELNDGSKDLISLPNRKFKPLFTNIELQNLSSSSSFNGQYVAVDEEKKDTSDVEDLPNVDRFLNRTYLFRNDIVTLPNFVVDYSDLLMGALIERVSDSWDLYITSFFICHKLLEPREGLSAAGGLKVHPDVIHIWQKALNIFEQTSYKGNGIRDIEHEFKCKIRNSEFDKKYIVEAVFVPNNLSPDSNSNRRYDILRCKMQNTQEAYMKLAGSYSEFVYVEIVQGSNSLIKYRIPWSTRGTGYMLSPAFTDKSVNSKFSKFDYWKGFNRSNPGVWTHDKVYMCVPGSDLPVTKENIPHYLEFIQHHLHMGVEHIFIVVNFAWDSINMKRLLRILESFISSNLISISSHSGDQVDMVFSVAGMAFERDNVKNLYTNMCNYFSKGVADYTAVWDFDEYFVPKGKNTNLIDMVYIMDPYTSSGIPYLHGNNSLIEVYNNGWKGGPGLADGDAHPLCSITLDSDVLFYPKDYVEDKHELDKYVWMGDRFPYGTDSARNGLAFKKSIRPTRIVFQGGLHIVGACRLPPEWNSCNGNVDLCYGDGTEGLRLTHVNDTHTINFNLNHRFDEKIFIEDMKLASSINDGVIYHMQFHRHWFKASDYSENETNCYTGKYFEKVLGDLNQKDLFLPFFLPENTFTGVVHNSHSNRILVSMYGSLTPLSSNNDSFLESLPYKSKSDLLFLSSIIERIHNSFELNVLIFAVKLPGLSSLENIEARNTFNCRIRNHDKDKEYSTTATIFENNMNVNNTDNNNNNDLIVIRCNILNTQEAYLNLITSTSDFLYVELKEQQDSLIKYKIPWLSRSTGYMLSPPSTKTLNFNFNYWKGFDKSNPNLWSTETVYLVTTGIEIPPDNENFHLYLEFIQHHILMGIDKIILVVPIERESIHMLKLLALLKNFIFENKLLILSSRYDDHDLTLIDININNSFKIKYINWVLSYLSKGLSEIVLIQNINQLLIPKREDNDINNLLKQVKYEIEKKSKYCLFLNYLYIPVDDYIINNQLSLLEKNNWLGTIFKDGPINDNNKINFEQHDGIMLSTKLKNFECSKNNSREIIDGSIYNYPLKPLSINNINKKGSSSVKIQYNSNNQLGITKPSDNIYSIKYFDSTYNALRMKHLDLIVEIPLKIHYENKPDHAWVNFKNVYDSRKSVEN